MRFSHLIAAPAALLLGATLAGVAGAQSGGGTEPTPPVAVDPCAADATPLLLCPDLIMYPPQDIDFERPKKGRYKGRVLMHSDNHIVNKGTGPAELNTVKTGRYTAKGRQRIYKVGGGSVVGAYRAKSYFKAIPGQYRYWKWVDAARMEVRTIKPDGEPGALVRTSPKQIFCLRDLNRRTEIKPGPKERVYPSCSQNPNQKVNRLGTSAGWSDDYPAPYHEQWTDVTGVPAGRYFLIHIADPTNVLIESDEDNNATAVTVTIPRK